VSNKTMRSRSYVAMSLAQLVQLCKDGWLTHMPQWAHRPRSRVLKSWLPKACRSSPNFSSRLGRWCLSHLQFCQLRLIATRQQGGVQPYHACSLFVRQAGDLG